MRSSLLLKGLSILSPELNEKIVEGITELFWSKDIKIAWVGPYRAEGYDALLTNKNAHAVA
jgi:hypothetical protein